MNRVFQLLLLFIIAQNGIAQSGTSVSTKEIEVKIDELLANMSLEEKVGQTCQITLDALFIRDSSGNVIEPFKIDENKLKEAIEDYHIGSVLNVGWHTLTRDNWDYVMENIHNSFNNGNSKVPIIYGIDAIHGVNYTVNGTLFPQEIGLAATWNPKLACEFGEVTAYETRASGIPWNFSPVLDLGRQPLWSRTFETLGEDPYLGSKMAEALVCGYQGKNGVDEKHVAACLKHFVGYSNPQSGRDRTPAWIPDKFMKELYLPSFKSAVEKGALTIMINSGDVNGVPGHKNYQLLTELLKNEWGFKGFTVSDWEDFIMLNTVHRTAESTQAGIVQAFNAGVDMSMVPYAPQYKEYCNLMKDAVENGMISMARLDDAVRRILRVKFIVGLFEKNMNQLKKYGLFGSEEHQQKALNSAVESITLLKNDGVLPLNKSQKVLVAGPTANNLMFQNGAWSHTWQGDNPSFNTANCLNIRESIEQLVGKENCSYSTGVELYNQDGYEASRFTDTIDFKTKSSSADVIVLCLGEYPSTEKPGDIRSLRLTLEQIELAKIAYRTGKPVVVVLLEGRPRVIHDIVEGANSIVHAYLPGDYGGLALSKLLFGEDNFSGKLPYTYPKYDGQIEFYDRPRSVDRHKSNAFNGFDPEWEFGYGLSYTSFEYSELSVEKQEVTLKDSIIVTVQVRNTGDMKGKEVVQLYLSDDFASMVPAGKKLVGFEKVELNLGETKTVEFVVHQEQLMFVNQNGEWISEPGTFSLQIADLETTFILNRN